VKYLPLFALVILLACQNEESISIQPPTSDVASFQFDIHNTKVNPSETESVKIVIHISRQSLVEDSRIVVLDSTFTLSLKDSPALITINKSVPVADVAMETVIGCISVTSQGHRGVTSCQYMEGESRINHYELYTSW
jgi:hypothetical protein